MGAGQIGGIATLLDIDFHNPAGFIGKIPDVTEAQHVVLYMSQAMMFCTGALIEAHVVLTPASCVYGEKYKFEVTAGTHRFLEHTGSTRKVHHLCIHKGYNHTNRFEDCSTENLALLVLSQQFSFNFKEPGIDYVINRVRYGVPHAVDEDDKLYNDKSCRYYGWGSRRNGYLIPLLITLRRVSVTIMPPDKCVPTYNWDNKYLCIESHPCKSEKFGALCPDDIGSVIVCSGFIRGMMTSGLVDRPCGIGFLDLSSFSKFLTCGVDDSRDVVDHEDISYDFTTRVTPHVIDAGNETTIHY